MVHPYFVEILDNLASFWLLMMMIIMIYGNWQVPSLILTTRIFLIGFLNINTISSQFLDVFRSFVTAQSIKFVLTVSNICNISKLKYGLKFSRYSFIVIPFLYLNVSKYKDYTDTNFGFCTVPIITDCSCQSNFDLQLNTNKIHKPRS